MAYNGYPNYGHYPPGYEQQPRYAPPPINLQQTAGIPTPSPVSQPTPNQYPNGTNIHPVATPGFTPFQVDAVSIPTQPPPPPPPASSAPPPAPRNRKSPSGRKIKREQGGEGNEVQENQAVTSSISPHTKDSSQFSTPKTQNTPTGPPPHMIQEFTFMENVTTEAPSQKPGSAKKGADKGDKQGVSPPKTAGKGRKKQQGMLVDINHVGRDMALAEQAMKRRRVDGDEPIDDSEDRALQGFFIEPTVRTSLSGTANEGPSETKLSMKRPSKSEGVRSGRRDHHACDRCFRNKTKCSRQVDGKPPSKHFPCDYCVSINGICTNAIALAKKPDSLPLSEETHWKQWKFKDILSKQVEDDNLALRKEVANYEKKFNDQTRLHEAVKAHNTTLEQQLASVSSILKGVIGKKTYWQNLAKKLQREIQNAPEDETYMPQDSVPPSIDFIEAFRIDDDLIPGGKHDTSVHRAIAAAESNSASSETQTLETMEKEIQTYTDVLSDVAKESYFREYRMPCGEVAQLNRYVLAYFINVHPLLPVLHREAFLQLYHSWGKHALADGIQSIEDAGRPAGRAVCLIWAVAALGALSLVETRDGTISTENPSVYAHEHFREALGFYRLSLQLAVYTRDTLETMIAYLLMGVFAIQTTDIKEAFRRLQNFQTQALSLNLPSALGQMWKNSDFSYEYDLWPGVTNFIMIQMVSRAWSMFRFYLSSVSLELGLLSNIVTDMAITTPAEIDDEVCGYDTKKEYYPTKYPSGHPNPIAFVLCLGKIATIADEYSRTCWIKIPIKRADQLAKYRGFWSELSELESDLPPFLDWNQHNSAFSNHASLSVQRPFIETQINCIKLKLARSIADLDPALLDRFRSVWNIGDLNSEAMRAGRRVVEIAGDMGVSSSCYRFYHFEVIRSMTSLVRMLLGMRKAGNTFAKGMDHIDASCVQGLEVSRKLVPPSLTKVEGKIEQALHYHRSHPPPLPSLIQKKEDEDEKMEVAPLQITAFDGEDEIYHDGFDFLGQNPYSNPSLGIPFSERSDLDASGNRISFGEFIDG